MLSDSEIQPTYTQPIAYSLSWHVILFHSLFKYYVVVYSIVLYYLFALK